MENKRVNFNAPLNIGDSETETVGCRANNPDICKHADQLNVCAFVRADGICKAPSAKWAVRYKELMGEANGD